MKLLTLAALVGLSATAWAAPRQGLKVEISNPSDFSRHYELVELSADSLASVLGAPHCRVINKMGRPVMSQVTHDGKLLFRAGTDAGQTETFYIVGAQEPQQFEALTAGRVYPERADDLAWENEFTAFRAYGPTTQRRGERGYGYDLFVKHPSPNLMLGTLYRDQNSPANWAKVDSLRKIDRKLGDDFYDTFSYHKDHGLGMDCYAVGPTLGAGIAAPMVDGQIAFPWCYEKVQVLDNGPLRFSALLTFGPRTVGTDSAVVETRLISLDAGSHFNNTTVSYSGLTQPVTMVAGFPRRDNAEAMLDANLGMVAYNDPTTGPDNGRIYLGVILPQAADSAYEASNHILAASTLQPGQPYSYKWGFAWSRGDMPEFAQWTSFMATQQAAASAPLRVTVIKAKAPRSRR